ncbi:MAG: DUF3237 domain-containing protein [Egibacteraceae bacterium]
MHGSSLYSQAASLLHKGDLPTGVVAPGIAPVVAVAAPPHPSNAVLVEMRRDGGPAQVIRGVPEPAPFHEAAQWFRAVLPALNEGSRLDYRAELIRAGQRLATLPSDGSWLTVIGGPDAGARSAGRSPTHESSASERPRWTYDLTFFAALTVNVRPEILGETPEGYRINFFVESGRVVGPRIDAVVRGGDWVAVRRDGLGVLDVRFTCETVDGALILYRAGGIIDLGPDGYAKVAASQFTGCPPIYSTPTFTTAHPDWQWLNRCQGFSVGRVMLEELQIQSDLYIPKVGDRRGDG